MVASSIPLEEQVPEATPLVVRGALMVTPPTVAVEVTVVLLRWVVPDKGGLATPLVQVLLVITVS